ncbi:MAG: hypothetical protein IT270_09290 [Saprospiraceae bacterium]|nr:hypothetical protein [Saprospiraceae bacterium]
MKHSLFIGLMMTAALQAFAQVDYTVVYHPFIHQAEDQLVLGNYASALPFYQKAFEQAKGGFSEDFANAAVCAAKSGQDGVAYRWLDSLLAKGVENRFFNEFQGLEPLRSRRKWTKFVAGLDQKRAALSRPRNEEVKATLIKMRDETKSLREKGGTYDTLKVITTRNVARFLEIVAQFGYPGEDMLGVSWPGDTMPENIMLEHYTSMVPLAGVPRYDFQKDFLLAVRQGRMEPHFMASLVNITTLLNWDGTSSQDDYFGGAMATFLRHTDEKGLYAEKFDADRTVTINQRRLEAGLEPLDVFTRKAIFKHRNPVAKDFLLTKWGSAYVIELDDPDVAREVLNMFEKVD